MSFFHFIFKKKLKTDIILCGLFLSLTFYAWRFLPELILRGGDFTYESSSFQRWWFSRPYTFTGFQTAAVLSGTAFSKYFGIHMPLYYWTEFITVLLIDALFYIFIRIVTKNSFIAFAGSLIAAVNYFGNFDMLCCITRFQERVLVVPLLMLSLILLQIYLEKLKIKYFFWSLFSYFLGYGLAHFSLLFSAPYILYPIFWYLFKKLREKYRGFLIGLPYLGISTFFVLIQQINEQFFNKEVGIFQYLLHPQENHYLEYMLRQLVYWSQYPTVIQAFLAGREDLHNIPSVTDAIQIAPYVIVVYFFASIYAYKKLPEQRALLFTVIFSVATNFFLNAWFGQYIINQHVGSNRYLYFSTFLLAIFWSLFLWAAFWKKKLWIKLIGLFILITFYIINLNVLKDASFALKWINEPTKSITNYIVDKIKSFDNNTLIVGHYPLITTHEAEFYTEQVGRGKIMLISDDEPFRDWRKIASSSAHVIKLTYDRECKCVVEEKIK